MKDIPLPEALNAAVTAARAAGQLMRRHWRSPKQVNAASQYDIKLELDVRAQRLIERKLRAAFPKIPMLAEEGDSGDVEQAYRWVVDPIDGTVNFAYGIPHACTSIALQRRRTTFKVRRPRFEVQGSPSDAYETVLGVVFDPFTDELWTAIKGRSAKLNGRIVHVSTRCELAECLITTGFAKSKASLDEMLPYFGKLAYSVRKVRMLGSAALALTYVATGRLDAYIESRVSLWDIAAGGLIVECAGGEFWREEHAEPRVFSLIASNGRIRRELQKLKRA
jgi:myo-inositol-1(or 4)-monophosphatase